MSENNILGPKFHNIPLLVNFIGLFSLSKFIMTPMAVRDDEISDRFGGHFDGWSDEDVIRAYLVHQLRRQEAESLSQQMEYLTPMRPMFTSSSQLAGYRSLSGGFLAVSLKAIWRI